MNTQATIEQIYAAARNVVREAQYAAKVHCETFAERPVLCGIRIPMIRNETEFGWMYESNDVFQSLFSIVGRKMPVADAWDAFKLAFNHDGTDYRPLIGDRPYRRLAA